MKHFCLSLCLILLASAGGTCFSKRVAYAQTSSGGYDDGNFTIFTSVNVDGKYYLYLNASMVVDFDEYEDIDSTEVDLLGDEDGSLIGESTGFGSDQDTAVAGLVSNQPVATGHEYGAEADGYACYDEDGEGDDDCEYIGSAYTSVDIGSPAPQITGISPSSVQQGDLGTLTMNGTNLVEGASDQLTLNYSGSGMPFTLTGTPSSTKATFSYNLSGYDTGTYQISVTNQEGTSNQVSFTVTPPQNACSQSITPNVVTLQIVSLGNQAGTLTISHPTAMQSGAATTVSYGPFSTLSSVASSIAATIVRNYGTLGMTAQATGSTITFQSRSIFGSITASSSNGAASVSIGSPSSVSCFIRSPLQLCFGYLPRYDVVQPYAGEPNKTAEQHIIDKHISGTPVAMPLNTVYIPVNPGDPPQLTFEHVVSYNFTTVFFDPIGKNGVFTHMYKPYQQGNYVKGHIGVNAAGTDLYGNLLRLTSDRCTVRTSYPTLTEGQEETN